MAPRDLSRAGGSSRTCTLTPLPRPSPGHPPAQDLTDPQTAPAPEVVPALRTAPAVPSVGTRLDFLPRFPLLSTIKGRGDWWIFKFFLLASLIGGNSLPAERCGPGRGQEQERARCCPVFVCCLRMHSNGGMDHLGEAAGSRGAAALHYDREVSAPSRPSGSPRGVPLTSSRAPTAPSPSCAPSHRLRSMCLFPGVEGLPDAQRRPPPPAASAQRPHPLPPYEAPPGGSLFSQWKRSCWLSRGALTLQISIRFPK